VALGNCARFYSRRKVSPGLTSYDNVAIVDGASRCVLLLLTKSRFRDAAYYSLLSHNICLSREMPSHDNYHLAQSACIASVEAIAAQSIFHFRQNQIQPHRNAGFEYQKVHLLYHLPQEKIKAQSLYLVVCIRDVEWSETSEIK
jgi:hypothetical protein